MRLIRFSALLLITVWLLPLRSQDRRSPQELLDRALHFADLYNWDDAGVGPPMLRTIHLVFTASRVMMSPTAAYVTVSLVP